ncbi:nicotinate (nicotinamide) nucleotide adenylyltransferase [Hydrogenoanaerobacterium sp.]|uniref:nicotinate (nicotinamide) nucleotide adenylyltransferase n=1 Tax=Hydrogenoanaerobacterium sp. TaxID=2953763 RepID=UPI00289D4291|nr:nicotinate (nicotinamide) nucleotide adenylyltransferase [Hydrogenoanaerobacterium sp.]
MQKILIFGGTFNPIHLGHIRLYRHFADKLSVDKVLIVPAKIPPHKRPRELASAEDRIAMCRLAVQDDPRAEISDIELRRDAVSFTVDTLTQISADYKGAQLSLVIGSDMFFTLDLWREPEKIIGLAAICALARHPDEYDALLRKQQELQSKWGGHFVIDNTEVLDISSTQLRQMVKDQENLSSFLPEAVIEYIKTNGLYKTVKYDFEQTKELLRQRVCEKRYEHSLAVAEEAAKLAQIFGENQSKAYFAGLIHDICKDETKDEQLQRIQSSAIILDDKALKQPPLWHAIAGSIFIQDALNVTDEDIINAVRYHTTARAGMSKLEKIIFLADLTSADREYGDVEKMRALAKASLEKAMLYAMQYIISDLVAHKTQIVNDTMEAYNEYVA